MSTEIAQKLSWVVEADEPPTWGRRSTKEELEELKKEKHTPGKKKKRGRSQHLDQYSQELQDVLEKGKRCGKSYIAKEDECHVDEFDPAEEGTPEDTQAPKKPRTKKGEPHGRLPKTSRMSEHPEAHLQQEGVPEWIQSPEGGKGKLMGPGYLANGQDGMFEMQRSVAPHRIYIPRVIDQAAAQYVSSAVADLMGLSSHVDYYFRNIPTNQVAAGHKVMPFVELDEVQMAKLSRTNPDIGGWFIHSVLVRHDDVVGENFDNMVMLKSGRPTVLHFGGTLLWTLMGARRPEGMLPDRLPELQSLRSPEMNWQAATVFGAMQEQQISAAIAKFLKPVKEKDILDLVDAARFSPEDRAEIGTGLVMRKRLLENM